MKNRESLSAPAAEENEQSEQVVSFDSQKAGHRILEASKALGLDFRADVYDQKDNSHDTKQGQKRSFESILSKHESLVVLRDNYLEQYNDNSRSVAEALSVKDELDQYILEQLSGKDAANFARSPEFESYSHYIYSVARKKARIIDGRKFYPEFTTNPILRNPKFRSLILANINLGDKARSVEQTIESSSNYYVQTLENINSRLEKRADVSQDEVDAVGDFLYCSKQYKSKLATNYAGYLFNEGRKRNDLKASTEICGALTNYFAHEDTRDPRLKDTRIYLANFESYDRKRKRLIPAQRGVSYGNVVILGQKYATNIDLRSDEGLQRSRQSSFTDLYSLMMVTYHELTHSYQALQMNDGEHNSSAMSMILNRILRGNTSVCFPVVDANLHTVRDKNGDTLTTNYYGANHDNDEMEIEADEESWKQCRKFIRKHERLYNQNNPDQDASRITSEHLRRCIKNAEEVAGRRSFTLKVNEDGVEMPYIQYDIEQLSKSIQQSPDLLRTYPQLARYFDNSGNIRPEIFFRSEIAGTDFNGITSTTDNFGVEIATYALLSGKMSNTLVDYVSDPRHDISQEQTKTCLINLWNTLHQPALKTRALKGVNFDNYVDTVTRGKFRSIPEIRGSYLGQYIRELYNGMRISHLLKKRHPEMIQVIEEREGKYFAGYYGELSRDASLEPGFREAAKNAYRRTGHKVLTKLAEFI